MMTDSSIVLNMIEYSLPKLMKHLKQFNSDIFLKNLLYKWFISLFMENMNKKICYIILDFLFMEGNIILFKATLLILYLIQNKIFMMDNIGDFNNFFENDINDFNDKNFTDFLTKNNFFKFDINYINKKRKETIQKTKLQILKTLKLKKLNNKNKISNNENNKNNNENIIQCDLDFPECLKNNEIESKINSFFIYKQLNFPQIIEDFYDYRHNIENLNKNQINLNNNRLKELSKFNDENVIKTEIFGNLLIERQKHFCNCNRSSRKEILGELNKEKITNMRLFFEEKEKNSKNIKEIKGKNIINQVKNNLSLSNLIDIEKTVCNIDDKNKTSEIKESFLNFEDKK
jgi:hypothetical protein